MTTAQELGTIEKVDIREVWPTEDGHFTPWLGENLDKLGAELGMDLELVATEAPVGTFRLDVHARDTYSQGEVVIENQFGQTDHSHLGQILTYAGGFDAKAVVWIAENFRDEHREALDFLNRRTGEDTQFFGVEIELWKIGNSLSAVNFKLASTPNEWRKTNINSPVSIKSPSQIVNRRFHEQLWELSLPKTGGKVSYSSYRIFEYPVKNIRYVAVWHKGEPSIEVTIDSKDPDWNLQIFRRLELDKEDIETRLVESEADEWLVWDEQTGRQSSRIAIYRSGDVYKEREQWPDIQEWMARKYSLLKEVFGHRLAELVD